MKSAGEGIYHNFYKTIDDFKMFSRSAKMKTGNDAGMQ